VGVIATVPPEPAAIERVVRAHCGQRGVDTVIDPNGGRSFRESYALLAPLGRLVMFGASTIAPGERRSLLAIARGLLAMPRFGAIELMNDNRVVAGVNLGHLWGEQTKIRRLLDAIVGHVGTGDFTPVVDRVFTFEEAAQAHAYLQARQNFGKVLLRP
jgi:NADPH:quinone reductase-like Zn-dependent oxidoreductase